MRISDWSSDVCSSDLDAAREIRRQQRTLAAAHDLAADLPALPARGKLAVVLEPAQHELRLVGQQLAIEHRRELLAVVVVEFVGLWLDHVVGLCRSEEHTSELQSLMSISYAVFCLKKK